MTKFARLTAAIAILALQHCLGFSPCRYTTSRLQHVHRQYQARKSTPSSAHKNDNGSDSAINKSADLRRGSMAAATKELGKVPYGETSRKYRRTVFNHEDWIAHRSSSSRILSNLKSMFFSGIVRQLRPQVTAVMAVASFVLAFNRTLLLNGMDTILLTLPTLPFTISSSALGLLLVFRTNAAYARWMQGELGSKNIWS